MIDVAREDGFDFSSVEYADLYRVSAATLFQHPLWLQRFYELLVPSVGAEPLIVTGRHRETGTLAFLLPLVRRRHGLVRRVEFADLGVCDYASPVVDADALDRESGDLATTVRRTIGVTDLVCIDKLPHDANGFAQLLRTTSTRRHPYNTHPIELGTGLVAWRSRLDPGFVRHLERKRKRVRSNQRVLTMRQLSDAADIDAAFDRMREFRKHRFAGTRAIDLLQDQRYFDFYRAIGRDSVDTSGPGFTSVLTVDDTIVAASFGLGDHRRDVGILFGYDLTRYRNYSLGLLIVEDLIGISIAHRKQCYDLTIGHDSYKLSFGATTQAMYSVRLPITVRGRLARVTGDRQAEARQVAKRALAYQQRTLPKLRRAVRRGG